jgi:non-canonical poly(A) RNA polymerase PAPD5/7
MLQTSLHSGPEQTFYSAEDGVTYRRIDELSDSEEAEMDISGDEAEDSQEPSSKRVRLGMAQSASDNNTPKWSNPDPYSIQLPESATGTHKRKDVVQLIRKARVQTKEAKSAIPTEAEEFISCDFDDSGSEDIQVVDDVDLLPTGKVTPPTASKVTPIPLSTTTKAVQKTPSTKASESLSGHRFSDFSQSAIQNQSKESQGQPGRGVNGVTKPVDDTDHANNTQRAFKKDDLNTQSKSKDTDPGRSALGSRKRTHNDEIILPPHAKLKKVNRMPVHGSLMPDWKAKNGQDACPWMIEDHSSSASLGVW